MPHLSDENCYSLLKLLESQQGLTQREISKELGLSLGKVNFCLRALADIGLIKAKRFYKSQSKRSYLYILTPKGVKEKAKITMHFLAKKQHEYELLRLEIQKLQKEADKLL